MRRGQKKILRASVWCCWDEKKNVKKGLIENVNQLKRSFNGLCAAWDEGIAQLKITSRLLLPALVSSISIVENPSPASDAAFCQV